MRAPRHPVWLLLPSLLGGLLLACPGPLPECRVGADCASGVCLGDGTCAPLTSTDAGQDAGTGGGAGGGTGLDAGDDAGQPDAGQPDAGSDGGSLTCLPNRDGTITRDEVITRAGLRATFRVSGTTTFPTAGTAQADGGRTWDMTGMLTGDQPVTVETQPLAGQWFESDFPTGHYVAPLAADSDLLGVFQNTADALLLLGVASPADGLFATKLKYSPAAKVLAFPLAMGATWTTTSTVSGLLNGGVWVQTETYDSAVDRAGDVITPYATFPALRVRTVLTRTVGVVPTVTRSFLFTTECFGTVATVTSTANETATDFTQAAEVRRLTP